jgi:hypothetical protein
MRRMYVALALVTLALVVGHATDVRAQAAKTSRGTVAAMAGDSLTIKAADHSMTFSVDGKTTVEAYGAGTKDRQAQAAGNPGPKLADVIKVGQAVEVTYSESGGTMHASRIRAVNSGGAASGASTAAAKESGGAAAAKTSTGTVQSVSATAMTITGSSGAGAKFTQNFIIDSETKVVAKGAGTAAAAKGGKTSVTDVVAMGDHVVVSYHSMGDKLHASEIRVTTKAGVTK